MRFDKGLFPALSGCQVLYKRRNVTSNADQDAFSTRSRSRNCYPGIAGGIVASTKNVREMSLKRRSLAKLQLDQALVSTP